jgi:hypothetical protein
LPSLALEPSVLARCALPDWPPSLDHLGQDEELTSGHHCQTVPSRTRSGRLICDDPAAIGSCTTLIENATRAGAALAGCSQAGPGHARKGRVCRTAAAAMAGSGAKCHVRQRAIPRSSLFAITCSVCPQWGDPGKLRQTTAARVA